MIEPILKELEPIAVEELSRANLANPQFHSAHEGIAVVEEEYEEAKDEFEVLHYCMHEMKKHVFHDRFTESEKLAITMRKHALYLAAEAIQVAAMCDKYIMRNEVHNGD